MHKSHSLVLAVAGEVNDTRAANQQNPPYDSRSVEEDLELLTRLRDGDERAFVTLVGRYHDSMLRVARTYVPNAAVAEEVVQDAWLGVVRGLGRFEGRSSFKTWLFRILVNRARSAGVREHRSVPMGSAESAVEASRFDGGGSWISPPEHWSDRVDDRLQADKLADRIRSTLNELPSGQREVVTLHDVEGLSSQEVRDVLKISDVNQRVLLHRGRSTLRRMLEVEYGDV